MTDRFDDARSGAQAPQRGDDARTERLEREIGKHFQRDGGFTPQFQSELDNLKDDIRAQEDAKASGANSYVSKFGGHLPATYNPHHEIMLSEEMKALDLREIEGHTSFRAMKAELEQQGLTCKATHKQVWNDGAFGPRATEDAYARCITVRHKAGAELREPQKASRRQEPLELTPAQQDAADRFNVVRDELRARAAAQPKGLVARVRGLFGRKGDIDNIGRAVEEDNRESAAHRVELEERGFGVSGADRKGKVYQK